MSPLNMCLHGTMQCRTLEQGLLFNDVCQKREEVIYLSQGKKNNYSQQ